MLKRLSLSVVELILFTLLVAGASLAHAKSCDEDSLESVSDDGSILKMLSGQVFEVEAGDAIDTALWLPIDQVLVCEIGGSAVEIINTDENGEKAAAQRLRASRREWPGRPLDFSEFAPKKQIAPEASPYQDLIPKKGAYDDLIPTNKPLAAQGEPPDEKAPATRTDTTVYVKYRGPLNLAPFSCHSITRSSFVRNICFDDHNNYMLIDLDGSWYHYCDIQKDTVNLLLSAESIGHFYNTSIKGRFDCRTGHVPAYTYKIAPKCKSGAEICKPWERDWSCQQSPKGCELPKDSIITDKGLIVLPSPRWPNATAPAPNALRRRS